MLDKVRLIACAFLMMAGTLAGFQTDQKAEAAVPACCDIATTNQANNTIDLYDPAVDDWNSPDALKWSWKPSTALGYSSAEVRLWGGPSEAKRKGSVLVATAGQLATIAAYPSGTRIWAADVGIGSNPHSAELLPNGNLAVAASDGKWIRVYTSSQGPSSVSYAQFNLDFAHAAHWDVENELLWVIGYDNVAKQHIMTGLRVGGTDAKPTLTEDTSRRSLLPSPWGHDITPHAGDSNKLWVSTNAAVYVYDIPAKSFTPAPEAANRSFVKSVGSLPSGQIVEARPDNVKTPPGGCTANGWCTDTVDFYAPDMTRTVSGAAFYKARIWDGPSEERLSVLKGLTAMETFYTGTMPDGGLKLPDYYFVQAASPQDNLILTRFLDPVTGRSYLAVGNPSLTQTQMPVIQFDPDRDIEQVKEVSAATGEEGKQATTAKPVSLKAPCYPAR
ncbi:DUF6528 family protein [Paenibacillus sp. CC-CFT747]|nr:DUF6528 family protein [Paenibacillus sp. CC-CFT747]